MSRVKAPVPGSSDTARLAQAYRLHKAGRLAEAEDAYALYLADHPTDPAALNNAGALALQAGRPKLAVQRFEQLAAVLPAEATARSNLGYALLAAGRPPNAIFHLERAIQLDPDCAQAYNTLGTALERLERWPEAAQAYERALARFPAFADAAANLGDVLNRSGNTAAAREAFERALAAKPDHLAARAGQLFAKALDGDLDGALARLEALASPPPHSASFWRKLALLRHWSGDLDRAEDAYKQAAALDTDDWEARAGIASAQLGRGDFERGFRAFEDRPDGRYGPARRFAELPVWGGAKLNGTLLLLAERGLGDVVQFARFIARARKRVGEIMLLVDDDWQPLAPLVLSVAGVDRVLTDASALAMLAKAPIARASVLSLAYLLGVDAKALPGAIPYMSPPADRVASWTRTIGTIPALRVGLAWAARSRGRNAYVARQKSLPLAALTPVIATEGAAFVALQRANGESLAPLGALASRVLDLRPDIGDCADTAAIISALDLVIAADTTVAHIAGALGKPVWMLDRFNTSWRWRPSSERSPWYPTMRIFRQHRFGDWDAPIAAVAAELAAALRGDAPLV